MKLTATRDDLLSGLQTAARALSTRSAMPALGGVLIEVSPQGSVARATDMEMGLSVELDAGVDGEGSVLLPGRLLVDVMRALPPGNVVLALRSEQRDIEIEAGSSRFHLRMLPPEDFPRLPAFDESGAVTLPGPQLQATIERVARAASRDEVRPILTGILVSAEDSTLTMVATDSYRLSVKHTDVARPLERKLEANVPARALRELARVVARDGVETVEIAMTDSQAVFRAGSVVLSSRLIEGQFPSYRQLIPETFEHDVRLPREEFLDVTRRVRHLAQRNAPLRLGFAEGELTVAAETPDVGDASESMPVAFEGEALEIAFNPQFLIEGIESVESDELLLQLSSPLRPGLLRPVGDEDFRYLVMPIRLNV